ncbi:MAG: EAL domain-containing protein [Eubacteriales bacterium]|nr:EAL domain-containing protein [Eubacteriales bacterium]
MSSAEKKAKQGGQGLRTPVPLEVLYLSVFEQAPIGIAVVNDKSFVVNDEFGEMTINDRFIQILGRSREELAGIKWTDITYPDDLKKDLESFEKFRRGEIDGYSMEKRFIKPDGSVIWVNMIISPLTGASEKGFSHICLIEDITERKVADEALIYSNEHDSWTGLYNRNYLEKVLSSDLRRRKSAKCALISINMSTVQSLVKIHGFHYTQDLVKRTGEELRKYCSEDRMLFITYWDRFLFYVRGYSTDEELTGICSDISDVMKSMLRVDRIGAGIGVIVFDRNAENDVDQLLKKLLIASEKSAMSNDDDFKVFFYNDEMEEQIRREEDIRRELIRVAYDEDHNALFMQYQPVYDLKSDRICGFEALARLNSEKLGRVGPAEFIPIAERTKLIIQVGRRIIRMVFRFILRLREAGVSDMPVSINISAIQLLSENFAGEFLAIMDEMMIDPSSVEIEITESVFADEYDRINEVIAVLNEEGVGVAIDDFGTGYSSLARERELNVSCLKIDKFFVDRLLIDDPDKLITCDIISIAHKLGHTTIAEGVEHEDQMSYLAAHGCDKIQGFLISRPLDEDVALDAVNAMS